MAGIARESIALERLGRKLWLYGDGPPKPVEEAALDYYRSLGWDGYFTEKEDLEAIIFIMMCWLPDKPMRKKAGRLGPVSSSEMVLCSAADGWLPEFSYTYGDVMAHAATFTVDDIGFILEEWVATKRVFYAFDPRRVFPNGKVDTAYCKRLQTFFLSRGGTPHFMTRLQRRYPETHFRCLRAIRDIERSQAAWERSLSMADRSRLLEARHYLRIPHIRYKNEGHFEAWRGFVRSLQGAPERDRLIKVADVISACRAEPDLWWTCSNLDLEIWKGQDAASVEVKAPGDRLRPGQTETLLRDAREGHASWVLEVSEA